MLLSFFVHVILFFTVAYLAHTKPMFEKAEPLRLRVVEPKTEKMQADTVIPPKPKEKLKPVPKKDVASESKNTMAETAQPVLGLRPESLQESGTFAVPAGNTLLKEDDGTRIRPEDVKDFAGDLSSPARLIQESFIKPSYTDAAIDAGLEGVFVVDVFVDENGVPMEVELRKKIGFGMDERILDSFKKSKYTPQKNKFGKAVSGWTETKVRLVTP